MPAASCRIMPARSISRCETISASFGFSFRMGRKNRDNRMGQLRESVGHQKGCSETGSGAKIQGRKPRKSRRKRGFGAISREFYRVGKGALAPRPPFSKNVILNEERRPDRWARFALPALRATGLSNRQADLSEVTLRNLMPKRWRDVIQLI